MFRKCFVITIILLVGFSSLVTGQEAEDDCAALVEEALMAVDDACSELGRNEACYGHNLIVATNFDASALDDFADTGDTIDITQLASLTTAPLKVDEGIWGIALLSLQANLPDTMPGQNVTFVVFGGAELVNQIRPAGAEPPTLIAQSTGNINLRTGPGTGYAIAGTLATGDEITLIGRNKVGDWAQFGFEGETAWVYASLLTIEGDVNTLSAIGADETVATSYTAPMQAFQLTSGIGEPACKEAPRDGLLVQAPTDTTVYFQINGIEVNVGSTALLLLDEEDQLGVNTFDGEVSITSAGETQTVEPGYQAVAAENTIPTEPEPYDYEVVQAAPVGVLPERVNIPIAIPPSVLWVDTGIEIEAGDIFTVTATGMWDQTKYCQSAVESGAIEETYEDCIATTPTSPVGQPFGLTGNMLGHDPIWPMMDVPLGALIGRIGDGDVFGILEGGTFTATEPGTLYLGNNLIAPQLEHEGAYIAVVEIEGDE